MAAAVRIVDGSGQRRPGHNTRAGTCLDLCACKGSVDEDERILRLQRIGIGGILFKQSKTEPLAAEIIFKQLFLGFSDFMVTRR